MKRVATSIVLALFALYAIFLAPQWLFIAIVVLIACLCYNEYASIASASGVQGALYLGYAAGLIAMARLDTLPLLALALLTFALVSRDLSKALGFSGATVLGVIYVFLSWRFAIDLRQLSPYWLFYALSINWAGDVAAYYTGRSFGRHKLAPRVSPGKSWEGAAGSMLVSVAYGVWFGEQAHLGLSLPAMFALSAIANAAGQVGDLVESVLKRGAGVKDSGHLLPGHGGFLDRLDSSLFTLPVVYHFLVWVKGAVR
ncbi:MAG: phosphatidate cytidylyltransferase [Bryobacteraceae bacterium]|nr:phosphatidate cytidylyltransferase [Bryobacteraceae bacterium]